MYEPTLTSAYKSARQSSLQVFDQQAANKARRRASQYPCEDGRGAAIVAMEKARANWLAYKDAKARYETAAALKDLSETDESRAAYRAALAALTTARQKITPRHGRASLDEPQTQGLRYVGRVVPDSNEFDRRDDCGWHTDPSGDVFKDGTGLCFGVVYQLSGKRGQARFVGGYEFGGGYCGGPSLDFSEVYETPADSYWNGNATQEARETDVLRHADSMAKKAGETEREYQTAWRAGCEWSDAKEEESTWRQEALALLLLSERLAARDTGAGTFPTLCRAITDQIESLLDQIRESRAKRVELAEGDHGHLVFYPDDSCKTAFCEGAGVAVYPV